jgi:hypothetical protein
MKKTGEQPPVAGSNEDLQNALLNLARSVHKTKSPRVAEQKPDTVSRRPLASPDVAQTRNQEAQDVFRTKFQDLKQRIPVARNSRVLRSLKPGSGADDFWYFKLADLGITSEELERNPTLKREMIVAEKELEPLYQKRKGEMRSQVVGPKGDVPEHAGLNTEVRKALLELQSKRDRFWDQVRFDNNDISDTVRKRFMRDAEKVYDEVYKKIQLKATDQKSLVSLQKASEGLDAVIKKWDDLPKKATERTLEEQFSAVVRMLQHRRKSVFGNSREGKELVIEEAHDDESGHFIKYRYGGEQTLTTKPSQVANFIRFLNKQYPDIRIIYRKILLTPVELKRKEMERDTIYAVAEEKAVWARKYYRENRDTLSKRQLDNLRKFLVSQKKQAKIAFTEGNYKKLTHILEAVQNVKFMDEDASTGGQPAPAPAAPAPDATQPGSGVEQERTYEELEELLDSSELDELVGITGTSFKLALAESRTSGKTKQAVIEEIGVDVVVDEILSPAVIEVLPSDWADVEKKAFAERFARERVKLFVKEKPKK